MSSRRLQIGTSIGLGLALTLTLAGFSPRSAEAQAPQAALPQKRQVPGAKASVPAAVPAATAAAPVLAESGSGGVKGGGIRRIVTSTGVEYVTFDKYQLRLRHLDDSEIPAIQKLMDSLQVSNLPSYYKGGLIRAIMPGTERNYFYIDAITPEQETRLKQIYREIVKGDPNDDEIAAVTSENDTYLLPKYKAEASDNDQAKTLFHEALWVYTKGKADYQAVIEAEVEYGEYLKALHDQNDRYPTNFYLRLGKAIHAESLLLITAMIYDQKHGTLLKYGALGMIQGHLPYDNGSSDSFVASSVNDLTEEATLAAQKNPDSAVFKVLMRDQRACFYYFRSTYSKPDHTINITTARTGGGAECIE